MSEIMAEYQTKLEKQLPIVCGNALGAYLDTNIFMFPDAFRTFRADTHLFAYSYYAIRDRAILAVKKLIEPSGKNKVNVDSIIKIICAPDCAYLSQQDKDDIAQDFKNLQQSESASRLKKFRDVIAHDLPDSNDVMILYKDLMNTVNDILNILCFVYMAVFKENKMDAACIEMKEIARFLSDDYWRAKFVSTATYIDANGVEHQFHRRGGNVLIADTVSPVDSPLAWSVLWKIVWIERFQKVLAEMTPDEVNAYYSGGKSEGSLNIFADWFMENY